MDKITGAASRGRYRLRDYTTSESADTQHFGLEENRFAFSLARRTKMSKRFSGEFEFSWRGKTSGGASSSISPDAVDYNEFILGLRLAGRF